MITGDSYIGSNRQHRLSDQVSANTVEIAYGSRSRDGISPPAACCPEAVGAGEAQAAHCRSPNLCLALSAVPSLLEAAVVFKPETLVRWHRSGFRLYWRWKSRRRVGRPAVPADIRDLIQKISHDNPLWGAPRIHGELLKLGIDIAQSTVAKYISRRRGPRSPGWQVFLHNHTAHIAGVDLFVVPTVGFKLLYGLVILGLERRRLV